MAANREIERKFLILERPPSLEQCPSERIEQGYVALEDQREVRLRRHGEQLLLTVKRGSGGNREERQIELDADAFEKLWPLTAGRRIRKRRYRCEQGPDCFEIDVYEGELEGTITAEVEFGSETDKTTFEPPGWFGPELTGDARWANRSLAVEGRPRD